MSLYYLNLGGPDRSSKRVCDLRLPSAAAAEAAAVLLATAIARRTSDQDTGCAWLEVESEENGLVCIVVISTRRPGARTETNEDLDRHLALRENRAMERSITVH